MTKEYIRKLLVENVLPNDPTLTEEIIDTYLAQADLDVLEAEYKALYVGEVWDEVSPINGCPASGILVNHPFSIPGYTSKAYTIRSLESNSIVIFQATDFTKNGLTGIADEARAKELIDIQINDMVTELIISNILKGIKSI